MVLAGVSPRLVRLLELLLAGDDPIKVDALSSLLETSRRTVFRELETAEGILAPLQAELATIPGKGIVFSGSPEARESLRAAIDGYGNQSGSNGSGCCGLSSKFWPIRGKYKSSFFTPMPSR